MCLLMSTITPFHDPVSSEIHKIKHAHTSMYIMLMILTTFAKKNFFFTRNK